MSTPSLPTVDPTDIWWEELPSGRGRLPGRAHLRSDAPALNLDGTWQFRYGTRADGSDLGETGEIQVPGLWQLQRSEERRVGTGGRCRGSGYPWRQRAGGVTNVVSGDAV